MPHIRTRSPVEARRAQRTAIDRALAAKLSQREMRVFLSLVMLISEYDRTEDRVANLQVAQATGIDERHVRRALVALHAKEVIFREPGRGRRASLISLDVDGAKKARAARTPATDR